LLARLKKKAAALGRKVKGWTNRIAGAQERVRVLTGRIDRQETRLEELTDRADAARRAGNYAQAQKLDKVALNLAAKLGANKEKRRFWIGRVKQLRIEKQGFVNARHEVDAEIQKLDKKLKFNVEENTVTGGTRKARFRGAALLSSKRCLSGKRVNFYSQPGTWSVNRCFTGEPYGYRSDCSQWLTSVCKAADLPDPNGTDFGWGYTGTLVGGHNGWRQVTEAAMREAGFGFVVYGSGVGFHVEAYVGPGDKTIGHGSAPIDPGRIDLLGDGNYRCFTLK
jgi:hypothetical protein